MENNVEMDFGTAIQQIVPEGIKLPGTMLQNVEGIMESVQMILQNINPLLTDMNNGLSKFNDNLKLFSTDLQDVVAILSNGNSLISIFHHGEKDQDKDKDENDDDSFDDSKSYSKIPVYSLTKFSATPEAAAENAARAVIDRDLIANEMALAGASPQDIAQAQKAALADQMKFLPSTETGNLNALFNLYKLFKNMPEAITALQSLLPQALRTSKFNGGSDDVDAEIYGMAEAGNASDEFFNPKTHELNQAVANSFGNGMALLNLATKGKLEAGQFATILDHTDQPIIKDMDSAAGFAALAPLVSVLDGKQVTPILGAVQTLFDNKTMSPHETEDLQTIGISEKNLPKTQNPVAWASWLETVLIPAMDQHGYVTNSAQAGFLKKLTGNGQLISTLTPLLNQLSTLETESQNYQDAAKDKRDSYAYISGHSLIANIDGATVAADTLMGSLAKLATPQAIKVLKGLTDFLNAVDKFAQSHPKLSTVMIDIGLAGAAAKILAGKIKSIIDMINHWRGKDDAAGQGGGCVPACCCEEGASISDEVKAGAEVVGGIGVGVLLGNFLKDLKLIDYGKGFRLLPPVKLPPEAPLALPPHSLKETGEAVKAVSKNALVPEVEESLAAATQDSTLLETEFVGLAALTAATGGFDLVPLALVAAASGAILGLYEVVRHSQAIGAWLHKEIGALAKEAVNPAASAPILNRFGGDDAKKYGDDQAYTPAQARAKVKAEEKTIIHEAHEIGKAALTLFHHDRGYVQAEGQSVYESALAFKQPLSQMGVHLAKKFNDLVSAAARGAVELSGFLLRPEAKASFGHSDADHEVLWAINLLTALDDINLLGVKALLGKFLRLDEAGPLLSFPDDMRDKIRPSLFNMKTGLPPKTASPPEAEMMELSSNGRWDGKHIAQSFLSAFTPADIENLLALPSRPANPAPQESPAPAKPPAQPDQAEPQFAWQTQAPLHGAVPVWIMNSGDIHNATVRAITQELDGVQFGPTGFDGSFSMPIPSAHW